MTTSKPLACFKVHIQAPEKNLFKSAEKEYDFDCIPLSDNNYKISYDLLDIGVIEQHNTLRWHWKEGILSQKHADLIGEQIDKFKEDSDESIIQPS